MFTTNYFVLPNILNIDLNIIIYKQGVLAIIYMTYILYSFIAEIMLFYYHYTQETAQGNDQFRPLKTSGL